MKNRHFLPVYGTLRMSKFKKLKDMQPILTTQEHMLTKVIKDFDKA